DGQTMDEPWTNHGRTPYLSTRIIYFLSQLLFSFKGHPSHESHDPFFLFSFLCTNLRIFFRAFKKK
ncbi:MAG: hypothetical protein ACPGSG_11935, partial [Prolixibacteraceae bacterium]